MKTAADRPLLRIGELSRRVGVSDHVLRAWELLELVEGEQEVAPGIHVVPAPGHTPGHMAIWLTSGSQHAVFVADAVLGETNFAYPDWTSVFDTDRAQAARTRRQLLDTAARDTAIVAGYHLWGPGMAERHADAYRWNPLR